MYFEFLVYTGVHTIVGDPLSPQKPLQSYDLQGLSFLVDNTSSFISLSLVNLLTKTIKLLSIIICVMVFRLALSFNALVLLISEPSH